MRPALLALVFCSAILVGLHGKLPTSVSETAAAASQPAAVIVAATPTDPVINAAAYAVFDVETGELLFAHDPKTVRPIASVTKLFTAATVLREAALTATTTVTETDVATYGRAGKLAAGQEYTVRELLFPLLLESSNDAATALERTVGPVSFAERTFADASGLSSANEASVAELAEAVCDLYATESYIFDITTLRQYIGTYTGWVNNSPVRDLPGYQGGKHGFTNAAGRTLVALFAEPHLGDRTLGYIILGSEDVRHDVETLRAVTADSVRFK